MYCCLYFTKLFQYKTSKSQETLYRFHLNQITKITQSRETLRSRIKKKKTEDAFFRQYAIISHCRAVPTQAESSSINNTVICFSYYCIRFTANIYSSNTFVS
jgi:hypothetical protein